MALFGPPDIETCKAKGDIKGLIKALNYPKDAAIRQSAAIALGELKDKHAVDSLILALKDDESFVRWAAAEALGEIKDVKAVDPLIVALQQGKVGMAATALGEIGDLRAIEPLINAGGMNDFKTRQRATNAIIKIGTPALKPLINALQSQEWHIKRLAIVCLGEINDPQAIIPSLLATLKNEDDFELLCETINALSKFKDERIIEPLLAMLHHENYKVRETAAIELGTLGDKRAVEPLITILETDEEKRTIPAGFYDVYAVREAAAIALGEIGDKRAIQPLIQSFALGYGLREKAVKALVRIGTASAKSLRSVLNDSDWQVRVGAVEVLGEIKDQGAVDLLIARLKDDEDVVRYTSAAALGKIGDKRAIGPLKAANYEDAVKMIESA